MHWNGALILILTLVVTCRSTVGQENEESESEGAITTVDVSTVTPSSPTPLDTKLRSALLKALTDLENEATKHSSDDEGSERDIKRAQASTVTIFEDGNEGASISSPSSSENEQPSKDPSEPKAEIVFVQKSDALQSQTITSLEQDTLDPFKDAEQIITSASNSFVSENGHQSETRSVPNTVETKFNSKITSSNLNAISNSESKKPSKITEKFSIGKAVDEPKHVKTYVQPLGLSDDDDDGDKKETATEAAVEVSTEESEAKVEQVQFFTAPLVAAFTVHQDEKGHPKKVERIYKDEELGLEKEERVANIPRPTQTGLSLALQQKQQILEQELEKLRNQQRNVLLASNTNSNNQAGFKQAINQNFNQFDPVFTEPDRSIVTKLATIDPSELLNQNLGPVLNRFSSQEAILPRANPNQIVLESKPASTSNDVSLVSSISFDPLVEAGKLPANAQILPNKEPRGFHSFVKLPKLENQQNYFAGFQPSSNFIETGSNGPQQATRSNVGQSNRNFGQQTASDGSLSGFPLLNQNNRFLRQEQGANNVGFNQNTFSIVPAQQPFAPKHELSYFPDNNRFLKQKEPHQRNLAGPNQNFNSNNPNTRFRNNNGGFQSFDNNQNRFRSGGQEGGAQKIAIQQSVQPFGAQPLGNRFFRPNQENSLNLGFGQAQNTRILRSNQEGTRNGFAPVLQNYRYSSPFGFPSIPLI